MNIKIDERFQLNQSSPNRFDLIEKVIRQKKDSKDTYEAENVLGYDMSLETCVGNIISEKLKENKETVTLKQFLEEYKKEKEQLLKTIKLD
jgi:hypothetical protein